MGGRPLLAAAVVALQEIEAIYLQEGGRQQQQQQFWRQQWLLSILGPCWQQDVSGSTAAAAAVWRQRQFQACIVEL
jgi:hypothetical protein